MSTFHTTEPEVIREALARVLEATLPSLDWQDSARWTWTKDAEVSGALRNFDLLFEPETEVITNDIGGQGAYGGGIEYACDVQLVVSYPVRLADLSRFRGSDGRDLTALLVRLHADVPGMMPQRNAQDRRVVPSYAGTEPNYIGTFAFKINFFAVDTVAVAS